VRAVAWSPDGRYLLSGGDDLSLKVWEAELGELHAEYKMKDKIMSLSAAQEGSLVALGLGNGSLRVLNFETGEEISLAQYRGGIADLRWSYDGRYLAAGTDRLIQVWDVEEQELVQSINVGSEVLALDWGRTSHVLASGSYRGIIDLWSAVPGENILRIAGHTRAVKALAWSPQGDYLASGGEEGTIRIWDLQIRKERMQLRPSHSGPLEVLAWSPDGTHLASGGHDFLVRLWNMTGDGEYVGAFTERIKKPFVHSRGFEFAVGLKSVSHEDIVFSISWAPDGKRLASASWDQTVAIWDVPTRTQLVGIQNPQGWLTTVAWSPRGDQVAFGGYDQAVHVYSGTTGEEIKRLQGHNGWVQSLAWSPDGKHLASSGYDRKIYIWDLETDRVERTLSGDDSVVTVVEWSPCGRYLAGGSHSGTVRIWDVKTGEVLYTYPGQELGLQSLAWSPAGDQLAITEYNSIIILGELD
jgi:WD40 repeat protein